MRHRIIITGFALVLSLQTALPAHGKSGSGTKYPIFGRVWTEEELREAYEKVWRLYVVDQSSRMILYHWERGAFLLSGSIKDRAPDRRLIIESGGKLAAVQCEELITWRSGDTIELMVREAGTPQFSYKTEAGTRESLPQYADLTLSFRDFVRSLRRGQHYPELPELGTKANRKGLFRTERVKTNSIVDR
ncbi:MAG: hypothetical protein KJ626_14380 [Verrucomicrobia bacterium]|nr:hypothetical protein [Verrucomicrobiota bacterium]